MTFGTLVSHGLYALNLEFCKPGTGNTYAPETAKAYASNEIPSSGDTFAITGLTSETDYWVRVDGLGETSPWRYIRTKAATSAPAVPATCTGHADDKDPSIASVSSTATSISFVVNTHDDLTSTFFARLFVCDASGTSLQIAEGSFDEGSTHTITSLGDADDERATPIVAGTDYWILLGGTYYVGQSWHYIRTKSATPPSAPPAPSTLVSASSASAEVSFSPPSDLGSGSLRGYEVRYYAGSSDPSDAADWILSGETGGVPFVPAGQSTHILGLTAGTAYRVQARAVSDARSPWSASLDVTTPAQIGNSLIENISSSASTSFGSATRDHAQAFTTGTNTGGYLLTSVEASLQPDTGVVDPYKHIVAYIATGLPSATNKVASLVPDLTLAGRVGVRRNVTFSAPSGTVLTASTTYWLVIEGSERSGNTFGWNSSAFNHDSGEQGWSIANDSHRRPWDASAAWTTHNNPLRMRVNGLATDATAPTLDLSTSTETKVVDDVVTLDWSEDLDTSSVPGPGAFTVKVGGTSRDVTEVKVASDNAARLLLTLASPVLTGQSVTVSYTKPGTNPLRDAFNNEVANFTDTSITNATTLRVLAPALSSLPCTADTYALGEVIEVKVYFSEPVNVDTSSGTPRLTIDLHSTGIGEKWAEYDRGSGTSTLVFAYTVVAGNVGADGVAVKANSLQLNGGTISSPLNVNATLAHHGLGHNPHHQVNGGTEVSSTNCQQLLLHTFSHGGGDLNINGSPFEFIQGFTTGPGSSGFTLSHISINVGNNHMFPNATVKLSRGTTYSNRTDVANLTVPSAAASSGKTKFTAPGGGIHLTPNTTYFVTVRQEDESLSLMGITLPQWGSDGAPGWSPTLPLNRRDAGASTWDPPTATSVMAIEVVGSAPDETAPSFSAAAVDDDTLTVTFDEPLVGTSKPAPSAFNVMVAGSRRTVSTVAIDGNTVTLTLASPVDSGQAVTVGYTKPGTNPLKDSSDNEVASFSGKMVTNSTAPPAVTGVEITSDPGLDSTYGLDEVIEVTVTFNKPVYVDLTGGRPQLEIDFHTAGTGLQQATYRRGSGTSELVFGFTVVSANRSSDGVKVVANRLQLNGGTIRSLGGADATLTYGALAHDTDHLVDGSAAGSRVLVSNIGQTRLLAGNLASLDWAQGFTTGSSRSGYIVRDVEVHFTEAPSGLTVTLATGLPSAVNTVATFTNPSMLGTGNLRFIAPANTVLDPATDYWVIVEGTSGRVGLAQSNAEDGRGLADWSIADNNLIRSGASFTNNSTKIMIRVNGITAPVEPLVTGVEIISDPGADSFYGLGERIQVQVTFNQVVNVDTTGGTPLIGIDFRTETNQGDQDAVYKSGSGTEALVFEFTVVPVNRTNGGTAVRANTLALNGGTIRSEDGLNARLGHEGLTFDPDHQVNGSHAASYILASNINAVRKA